MSKVCPAFCVVLPLISEVLWDGRLARPDRAGETPIPQLVKDFDAKVAHCIFIESDRHLTCGDRFRFSRLRFLCKNTEIKNTETCRTEITDINTFSREKSEFFQLLRDFLSWVMYYKSQ